MLMREGEGAKEWVGSVCGLLMKVGVAQKGQEGYRLRCEYERTKSRWQQLQVNSG